MNDHAPVEIRFRIADWDVYPERNRLVRAGKSFDIEPKMMIVLSALARNPGAVVSRDDLQRVGWSDAFVTDDALNRCINQLRRVFEDDARAPRYIETISKRGYCLIAPVERLDADPSIGQAAVSGANPTVDLHLEGTSLLGHRATVVINGMHPSRWNEVAKRMSARLGSAEGHEGRLVLFWSGTRLLVEPPRLLADGGRESTVLCLRTRSAGAASPLFTGLGGFAIALLAVHANGMRWSLATAIVLGASLLGAVAGGNLRKKSLASSRQSIRAFVEEQRTEALSR